MVNGQYTEVVGCRCVSHPFGSSPQCPSDGYICTPYGCSTMPATISSSCGYTGALCDNYMYGCCNDLCVRPGYNLLECNCNNFNEFTLCKCTNMLTDPNHCGSCGSRCPTGKICSGGVCQ
jgi:hypothetical protein